MIDQSLIDRVALALVRQMLLLSGQIKGKHYTDEPRAFVVDGLVELLGGVKGWLEGSCHEVTRGLVIYRL